MIQAAPDFAAIYRQKLDEALGRLSEQKNETGSAMVAAAVSGQPVAIHVQQQQYAKLERLRRDVEELLGNLKAEIDKAAGPIMEAMAEAGMQRFTCEGLTCYVKRDRYVNKVSELTQSDVIEVLRQVGLGGLVSEGYNAAKLKSHVLEVLDSDEDASAGEDIGDKLARLLDARLAKCIKVGEVARLATQIA